MGKRFRNAVFLLVILLAAICIVPQAQEAQAATPRLNKAKVTLAKGAKVNLKVTGTNKRPKWSTDKKKVATVTSKGVVMAKGKGVARITARIGKRKLVCRVTVETPKLNRSSLTVNVGKAASLKVTGTKGKVRWYTTDASVAMVTQKGVVRGVRAGSCRVYAKVNGGTLMCAVSVKAAPRVTPTPTTAPIQTPTATPTPEPRLELNLSSEHQKVKVNRDASLEEPCEFSVSSVRLNDAEVEIGLIYQITPSIEIEGSWDSLSKTYTVRKLKGNLGYVDITAIYNRGTCSDTKRFTVEKDPDYVQVIPVENFGLDREYLHINEGETENLTYTVVPINADFDKVEYVSSDNSIASIDADGKIHGHIPGECTITATCAGFTSSCKIIVCKVFDHEEAIKSVSHEAFLSQINENKFVLIKAINNYKYPVYLQPFCKFYNEKNELIGNLDTYANYCLKSGGTSYFKVEAPKEFARYEVDFSVRDTNYASTTNVESVEVASYKLSEGASVCAVIRNNSNIDARYTYVSCAFYSGGRIVDIDYRYVEVRYLGAEENVSFGTGFVDKTGIDDCIVNIEYSC